MVTSCWLNHLNWQNRYRVKASQYLMMLYGVVYEIISPGSNVYV